MFKNREEAGRLLAKGLTRYKNKDAIVLAVPRGGVVVGYELAKQLGLPMDVVVVKKIGFPGNEEFALGAVGPEDYYLNTEVADSVPPDYIQEHIKTKQMEAKERYEALRGKRPMVPLKDRVVIIVDDGIATGATVRMAVHMVKKQSPKRIIIAVPVAPPETVSKLREVVDEVVWIEQPEMFRAIGQFYEDFTQVSDEEAKRLLEEANR